MNVCGVPYELRYYLPLWAIGTIIGSMLKVDMKYTKKMDVCRILVGVWDVKMIPASVDIAMGASIYTIFFTADKVLRDGSWVDFQNGDGFNADEDDLMDEEPASGEPNATHPAPPSSEPAEKEGNESNTNTNIPSENQLQAMADNILDHAAHRLIEEAADVVMAEPFVLDQIVDLVALLDSQVHATFDAHSEHGAIDQEEIAADVSPAVETTTETVALNAQQESRSSIAADTTLEEEGVAASQLAATELNEVPIEATPAPSGLAHLAASLGHDGNAHAGVVVGAVHASPTATGSTVAASPDFPTVIITTSSPIVATAQPAVGPRRARRGTRLPRQKAGRLASLGQHLQAGRFAWTRP